MCFNLREAAAQSGILIFDGDDTLSLQRPTDPSCT